MKIQSKLSGKPANTIHWQRQSGWNIQHAPLIFSDQNIQRTASTATHQKCINCNGRHAAENCTFPAYTVHCSGCLVLSLNGHGHENPCQPINKVGLIRSNLFATNALTLFKMASAKTDGRILYMNNDGVFAEMFERIKLVSGPAETLITQVRGAQRR